LYWQNTAITGPGRRARLPPPLPGLPGTGCGWRAGQASLARNARSTRPLTGGTEAPAASPGAREVAAPGPGRRPGTAGQDERAQQCHGADLKPEPHRSPSASVSITRAQPGPARQHQHQHPRRHGSLEVSDQGPISAAIIKQHKTAHQIATNPPAATPSRCGPQISTRSRRPPITRVDAAQRIRRDERTDRRFLDL